MKCTKNDSLSLPHKVTMGLWHKVDKCNLHSLSLMIKKLPNVNCLYCNITLKQIIQNSQGLRLRDILYICSVWYPDSVILKQRFQKWQKQK